VAWGCSFYFIKEGLTLPDAARCRLRPARPVGLVATVFVVATLGNRALPRERAVWVTSPSWRSVLNVGPGILFPLAETHTTSILAGIINAMTPLSGVLFMVLVFRDEPTTRDKGWGLVVGFVGVLITLAFGGALVITRGGPSPRC
jgi:drug/metabolite transporter (DMT)-like permease